ncbi:hypothetical protein TPE_1976 [Treponema pedis str. T A4]|uniref:Uncharacterized protein n=1 Tax=Treponema pedis str. T A4 TaxID=1291379 RepID=S5ZVV4_9SPIR|nr:hypothetical protein TPE_1976 [Treponema pedis str. T A4]
MEAGFGASACKIRGLFLLKKLKTGFGCNKSEYIFNSYGNGRYF